MLEIILNTVFGTKPERDRKKLQPFADKINALESTSLSNDPAGNAF